MTPWPAWVSWILLLAVVVTLVMIWGMWNTIAAMQETLASAGLGMGGRSARNREELEDLFVKGIITRDIYERSKGRLR
jgi:hypothetical protein